MRTFLWGEEDFLLWKKIQFIREQFIKKNPGVAVGEFDFEEDFKKDEIIKALHQGGGFFSKRGLFIAGNIFDASLQQQEALFNILSKANVESVDTEIILFQKGGLGKNKKSRLCNFLFDNYKIIEFKKLRPFEIKKWVIDEIFSFSGGTVKIEEIAVNKLVTASRENLWSLNNEIKKLVNYTWGRGVIKEKDIDKLSYGKAESKIFDLVDAIGQKNKKKALILVSSLLDQGLNEFYLFTMIVYQIRNLAKLQGVKEQDYKTASRMTGLHPFVVKKTKSQLINFSIKEIKRAYETIAQFDYELKTGKISPEKALYDLIVLM